MVRSINNFRNAKFVSGGIFSSKKIQLLPWLFTQTVITLCIDLKTNCTL